jgi:hypothetical protein
MSSKLVIAVITVITWAIGVIWEILELKQS